MFVAWGADYLGKNVAAPHMAEARAYGSGVPPNVTEGHLVTAMSRKLFSQLFRALGALAHHVQMQGPRDRQPAVVIACKTGLMDSSTWGLGLWA